MPVLPVPSVSPGCVLHPRFRVQIWPHPHMKSLLDDWCLTGSLNRIAHPSIHPLSVSAYSVRGYGGPGAFSSSSLHKRWGTYRDGPPECGFNMLTGLSQSITLKMVSIQVCVIAEHPRLSLEPGASCSASSLFLCLCSNSLLWPFVVLLVSLSAALWQIETCNYH